MDHDSGAHMGRGSPPLPTDERLDSLRAAALRVVEQRVAAEGSTRAGLLPLRWLRPEVVAAEAGLPVETFGELWGERTTAEGTTLSPYENFLFHVFGTYRGPVFHDEFIEALPRAMSDLEELVHAGGSDIHPSERDWLDFVLATAVSAFSLHERADYRVFYEEVSEFYEIILYQMGRRMRAPLTTRDLAMNLAAVLEGPWFRRIFGVADPNPRVMHRISPGSATRDWSIDGVAVMAIVLTMTEALDTDDAEEDERP